MPLNKKEDTLFLLVKSLNKSEKRFLTLYSQLFYHNKTPNYVHLFDILENLEVYDKEFVLKEIAKFTPAKHLSQIKRYLKLHLLSSLKQYDKNKNDHIKKLDELANAHILLEKGLLTHSEQILQHQKKTLFQKEEYVDTHFINMELIRLETSKKQSSVERQKKLQHYYLDSLDLLERQIKLMQLGTLVIQSKLIAYDKSRILSESQTELKKILEDFLLLDSNKFESLITKLVYLNNVFQIYKSLGEYNNCLKIGMEHYELSKHPSIIPNINIQCLTRINLLSIFLKLKDFTKCPKIINELQEILEKDPLHKKLYTYWYYLKILQYYVEQKDALLSESLVSTLLKDIEDPEINMITNQKNGLLFYLAKYYFKHKQIANTQDILLKITLNQTLSLDDFHFIPIKVINILCLYELNSSDMVNRKLLSLKRKLRREQLLTPPLAKLLKLFTQLNNATNHKTKKNQYYQEIQELILERISHNHLLFTRALFFLKEWVFQKTNKSS